MTISKLVEIEFIGFINQVNGIVGILARFFKEELIREVEVEGKMSLLSNGVSLD